MTRRARVYRHERQPHDARSVHGQADVSRLVERLRDVTGEHRVYRTHDDEQTGIGESDHVLLSHARQTHELVGPARRVVVARGGWTQEQPDGRDDDMDTDERRAEDELRAGTDVAGPARRTTAGAEDASDAVRLDEQRRVAQREEEADAELLRAAHKSARWRHDHERHDVAAEDAGEQDERQLSPGRLDDGRVEELDEDADDVGRQTDAQGRDGHGHDGDHIVVVQVFLR